MPKHVVVPAPAPAPVPATLTEQKADFTAEGSPPPGKVATTPPVSKDAVKPVTHAGHKSSPKTVKKNPKRAG